MNTSTSQATAATCQLILIIAALLCGVPGSRAQSISVDATPQASVFILDDLSGDELQKKHGIAATTKDDLFTLLEGVWQDGCRVQVRHLVIDEDSTKQAPGLLKLEPFTAKRPASPVTIGSLRDIEESRAQYFKLRTAYQQAAAAQLATMKDGVSNFMATVAETQLQTAQRFDAKLEARKGKDYNRSDVSGAVITAGRILGKDGVRVLLLNTDCVDEPGNGKRPRRTPFTAQELDAGVIVIFVNQSRLPDESPLFKGTKNPSKHADTMQEAMKMVVDLLRTTSAGNTAAVVQNPQPPSQTNGR